MKRISIAHSIIGKGLLAICISVLTSAFAITFFFSRFTGFTESLLDDRIIADSHVLDLFLEDIKVNSKVAARGLATNPELIRALKRGNREEIIRVAEPLLKFFPVDFLTVTDKQGKVLARVHAPSAFGDSILNQQNVRDALNGKTEAYIETGTMIKLSARAGSPVMDGKSVIGAVTAGVRLDSLNLAYKLKTLLHSDTVIFYGDSILATTLDEDSLSHIPIVFDSKEARESIDRGEAQIGNTEIHGAKYKTYYKPLMTPDGHHFATIFLCTDISLTLSKFHTMLFFGVAVIIVGLILSKTMVLATFFSLKKRLILLAKNLKDLAAGNLDTNINTVSKDEVGHLSRSLERTVSTLRKLFEEVFRLISEQKKGNINYHFVLEDFRGQYETLAENILQLSSLSIKDRLTGLPNRRSFYSRLLRVRERVVAENARLSILMIDVDSFKKLGFEHGNRALKTVADLCTKSLTQDVDIVSRWAGDLFIVLLPDASVTAAKNVAERIRTRVEMNVVTTQDGKQEKITVTIGVYSLKPTEGDSADDMIFRANLVLQGAKDTGRNSVRCEERE
ncbi:MAG: diguanylate cyclase [Holophagaceae bacterium]|nr:diguanylate cyclase [Holophagaceae bacterium]